MLSKSYFEYQVMDFVHAHPGQRGACVQWVRHAWSHISAQVESLVQAGALQPQHALTFGAYCAAVGLRDLNTVPDPPTLLPDFSRNLRRPVTGQPKKTKGARLHTALHASTSLLRPSTRVL